MTNTTNILITTGKGNTVLQAPPGNRKLNTKSIKLKAKVIFVGESIVSGVNGKGLSTNKFTTVARDIPGATSDELVHHTKN